MANRLAARELLVRQFVDQRFTGGIAFGIHGEDIPQMGQKTRAQTRSRNMRCHDHIGHFPERMLRVASDNDNACRALHPRSTFLPVL